MPSPPVVYIALSFANLVLMLKVFLNVALEEPEIVWKAALLG